MNIYLPKHKDEIATTIRAELSTSIYEIEISAHGSVQIFTEMRTLADASEIMDFVTHKGATFSKEAGSYNRDGSIAAYDVFIHYTIR